MFEQKTSTQKLTLVYFFIQSVVLQEFLGRIDTFLGNICGGVFGGIRGTVMTHNSKVALKFPRGRIFSSVKTRHAFALITHLHYANPSAF